MFGTKKEKIVIIGYGWVGQANAVALTAMGYPVFCHDLYSPPRYYAGFDEYYDRVKKLENPLEQEGGDTWYLICVGDKVSREGDQDISFIEKALNSVKQAKGRRILRSTVLPHYLAGLDFDYYLPEFLHEKRGVQECIKPYYFVVGSRESARVMPNFLNEWKENAHRSFEGTVEQASYIKYSSNIWNSLRISFVNELGDAMTNSGLVDTREAQKVIDFLFEKKIYLRYGKAFGGHCLPKDSMAFAKAHGQNFAPHILKAISLSNDRHKNLENQMADLIEWSSPWEYQSYVSDSTDALRFLLRRLLSSKQTSVLRKLAKPVINPMVNKIWGNNDLSDVRKTWNGLAKKNPLYFVNIGTPSGKKVSDLELRETGRSDYEKNIEGDELIGKYLKEPQTASVLEIGTGVARMTEFMARNFKEVKSIDISDEMVRVARNRLRGVSNASVAINDGKTIPFDGNSFNFIYSQSVFRYLPNVDTATSYLKEVNRTLKSGGLAKLQFRTGGEPRKWQWVYGVSFQPEELSNLIQAAGLKIIKYNVSGVRDLWVWLEK